MKRFLLAASVLIAIPAIVAAQPDDNQNDRDHKPAPSHAAPAQAQPSRPAPTARGDYRYGAQGQRPGAPAQGRNVYERPGGADGANGQAQRQYAPDRNGYARPGSAYGQRGYAPYRGGFNHEGWWRGQRGFENYAGRREGFWFAPGWGYYRVDPRWEGFNWGVGVFVPYQLRGYYIADPFAYGLPPAPWGCRWIFLGDQLVLINLQTGFIVQVAGGY